MSPRRRMFASWWRSPESTRTFWNTLLAVVGIHATVVGYALIWILWVGPATTWDQDTIGFIPEPLLDSSIGYAVVSLALFLGATYASGHRQRRDPSKVIFILSALYTGFSLGYVWIYFSFPDGIIFTADWLPIENVFQEPVLWPIYAAALLMAWRLTRPVPRVHYT